MSAAPPRAPAGLPWLGQALRFAVVGASNTLLDLALFGLLTAVAGLPPATANLLSYGAGIAWSFVLNGRWTFRDASRDGTAGRGERMLTALRFVLVCLSGLLLSTLLIALLSPPWPPLAAKLASVPAVFAWGFLLSRFFVFTAPRRAATPPG